MREPNEVTNEATNEGMIEAMIEAMIEGMIDPMEPSAQLLSRRWPFAISPALADELAQSYAVPPRAYHHLGHIGEVLGWFEWAQSRQPWQQPGEVCAAILFHDAVYVVGGAGSAGSHDNEPRSAEQARRAIDRYQELRGLEAKRVVELIELTARHGELAPGDVDGEAARFLDCDLAILAAPPERYRRYCDEIAEEYRAIPAEAYRAGRRAFVARLLARPRLFLSEDFSLELEAAARDNLRSEAESLGA
jgi:predicted metal-dependent HD superfamily phosphohydrolase